MSKRRNESSWDRGAVGSDAGTTSLQYWSYGVEADVGMAREKKKKKMERRGNGFIGKTLVRRELGFIAVFKFNVGFSVYRQRGYTCVYRCGPMGSLSLDCRPNGFSL